MNTEVRVKFFQINKCGYYRRHSSHPAFGDKASILEDLIAWIANKSISETSTYEPTNEQDSNLLHTYCYSLNRNTLGDFLLTTWNETATTDGAVASISLTGPVGDAQITTAEVQDGFQPGYPAYFWFPHEQNVYATVQIRNRLNGRHNLEEFIKGFLSKYSRFVVVDDENDDDGREQIRGYSSTGNAEDIDKSRPSFKSTEFRKHRNVDFIVQNRTNIRKMVRRDMLVYQFREKASLWQLIWRNVSGETASPILSGEHELQFEVDFTPSAEQLESMIRHWEAERDEAGNSDQFQDVGFKIIGDPKVHWLSRALASDLFNMNLNFSRPPIADADSLLSQLHRTRKHIMPLLTDEGDQGDED